MLILDELDKKLLENFRGYVVKKDLVLSLKVGANVPVFVLEYLIANSCSTNDEEKIREGMENVKKILSEHYVNPEESSLIHSKIREKGSYKIIDKISVRLDSKKDKYWGQLLNSNVKDANISDADLSGENLNDANLTDADLRGADLSDAYLTDANLTDAHLRGAMISDTMKDKLLEAIGVKING